MRAVVLSAVFCLSTPLLAADPEKASREKWEAVVAAAKKAHDAEVKRSRAAAVAAAEDRIETAKAAYKKAVKNQIPFSKQQEAKLTLERAEDALETAKKYAKSFAEPRFLPSALGVGDVAMLGDGNGGIAVFKIFQVIDKENCLVAFGSELYWCQMRTKGLADGDPIMFQDIVECTGTKQYRTALGGTKTVRVFRAY